MSSAESILVVGHDGLLGQSVCRLLGAQCEKVPGHPDRFNLADPAQVEQAVKNCRSGLVINCAGYTAVDRAEAETGLAEAVNGQGAGSLAGACAKFGKHLVHISTDYVFDGQKKEPYREDDPTEPLSAYGRSKLNGEIAVLKALPSALVVRSAWLYGHGKPGFIDLVLSKVTEEGRMRVVTDQTGCPTYTEDLALALIELARKRVQGTLHVVNSGQASRFEFARVAVKLAGLDPESVRPALTKDFPTAAARPAYSVLDTRRFARVMGGALPGWLDGLRRYLRRQLEESA